MREGHAIMILTQGTCCAVKMFTNHETVSKTRKKKRSTLWFAWRISHFLQRRRLLDSTQQHNMALQDLYEEEIT